MRRDLFLKLQQGDKIVLKQNAKEICPNANWGKIKKWLGKEGIIDSIKTNGTIAIENTFFYLPYDCFTFPNKKPEQVESGDVIENNYGSKHRIASANEFAVLIPSCSDPFIVQTMEDFIWFFKENNFRFTDQPADTIEVLGKQYNREKLEKRLEKFKPVE